MPWWNDAPCETCGHMRHYHSIGNDFCHENQCPCKQWEGKIYLKEHLVSWGFLALIFGFCALVAYVSTYGLAYPEHNVYDLGIDGETVKGCYSDYGEHLTLIHAHPNCMPIVNWYLGQGFKHTGEIIASEEINEHLRSAETFTKYIILTR